MNIDKALKWGIGTFVTIALINLFLCMHSDKASWPAGIMISILSPMAVFFYKHPAEKASLFGRGW